VVITAKEQQQQLQKTAPTTTTIVHHFQIPENLDFNFTFQKVQKKKSLISFLTKIL